MKTNSFTRLTANGVVMLEHGDEVMSPFVIPTTGESQSVSYVGGAYARTFGRSNRARTISWNRIRKWASVAERIEKQFTEEALYPIGETHQLTVTILGGATKTVNNFTLESYNPTEISHHPQWMLETFFARIQDTA